MTWAEKKEDGTKAYKEKRFDDAVKFFTEAIDSPELQSDIDELAKLYSNRCAAYEQLKKFKEALDDAESCTQIKPTFAKGWSRLGGIQFKRGCYAESAVAYEKASELDPSNADYKTQKTNAEAAKTRAATRSQPSAGSRKSPARMGQLVVRVLMFMNAFMYFTSFTTDQKYLAGKYRTCLQFYLGSALISFVNNHGLPKFSKVYLQQILTDVSVQRVFGAMLLFFGPNFVGLVAILLPELAALAAAVVATLKDMGRKEWAKSLTARLEGPHGLLDGKGEPHWIMNKYAAMAEVAAGIFLVLGMLTPRRNLIGAVLYWQYLQMRCMLEKATLNGGSGVVMQAFGEADCKINGVLGHKFCPSLLKKGYTFVRGLLVKQVALPEPGAKPKMSCVIS